jgi:hypothetical protein
MAPNQHGGLDMAPNPPTHVAPPPRPGAPRSCVCVPRPRSRWPTPRDEMPLGISEHTPQRSSRPGVAGAFLGPAPQSVVRPE